MTGLDTSQPITDAEVLHEGHVHFEEEQAKKLAAEGKAEADQDDQAAEPAPSGS